MKQAYDKYMKFISSLPMDMQPANPTPLIVSRFIDYLSSTSKGDGAAMEDLKRFSEMRTIRRR